MKTVDIVAVMPVGPDNNGADTIESIFRYCKSSVVVLAVDDSRNPNTTNFLKKTGPEVLRLPSAGYKGIRGALFCSLANAYRYAVDNYRFKTLLRIDTDALFIGEGADEEAISYFSNHPDVGMIGSYKVDCNGDSRNFDIVAYGMRKEYGLRGFINFKRRQMLRTWIEDAKRNGYQVGEHILGAVDFQSYSCIKEMRVKGYLDDVSIFKNSVISEDHFFSLLTYAVGYRLADFATGSKPMGVRWRGLPDSPENLAKRNKKIVHSVKYYDQLSENDIRVYFKRLRS